ncbi:MAG: hypothetical protein Q8905_11675 [Bacteroidota bacterium]|nr:hypothetical protein [Bacteroidota bacterium]
MKQRRAILKNVPSDIRLNEPEKKVGILNGEARFQQKIKKQGG